MPVLKYDSEIRSNVYDLSEYSEREDRKGYRWVFRDIDDYRNFLPVYVLFPERRNKRYICDGWALSMYETQKQAKDRLEFLVANDPNIYLKLGTHTAEGALKAEDGISDDASTSGRNVGHFNHMEYQAVDLSAKFEIIECIISA